MARSARAALDALPAEAVRHEQEVESQGNSPRFSIARREPGVYPTTEEMYVAAPALADDKQKPSFEGNWGRLSLKMAAEWRALRVNGEVATGQVLNLAGYALLTGCSAALLDWLEDKGGVVAQAPA